jgi:site-specific recombinase XerD
LADYIIAARSESNISDNYKKEIIKDLFKLSEFFNHQKSFKEITRNDLLLYLNRDCRLLKDLQAAVIL